MDVAAESEDTGTIQALKALDSLESKLNQVQVAYQQFYTTIGAESVWKWALDGIKNYIDTLNGLPKLFGKIPVGAITVIADMIGLIKSIAIRGLSDIASIWAEKTREITTQTQSESDKNTQNGQTWVDNFVQGIKSKIEDIRAAAKEAVDAANEEAKASVQEQQTKATSLNDNFDYLGVSSAVKRFEGALTPDEEQEASIALAQYGLSIDDAKAKLEAYRAAAHEVTVATQENNAVMLEGIPKFLEGAKGIAKYALESKNLASTTSGMAMALNTIAMLLDQTSTAGRVGAGVLMTLGGAIRAAGAAIQWFNASTKVAFPWLAVISGAIAVVNGLATAIENAQERAERLSKEAQNLNDEAKQAKAEYNVIQRSVDKINELKEKRYESAEAAEAYQTAVDELADSYPQLISGIDELGNVTVDATNAEIVLAKAREESAEAAYKAAEKELEAKQAELDLAKRDVELNTANLVIRRKTSVDTNVASQNRQYYSGIAGFVNDEWENSDREILTQLQRRSEFLPDAVAAIVNNRNYVENGTINIENINKRLDELDNLIDKADSTGNQEAYENYLEEYSQLNKFYSAFVDGSYLASLSNQIDKALTELPEDSSEITDLDKIGEIYSLINQYLEAVPANVEDSYRDYLEDLIGTEDNPLSNALSQLKTVSSESDQLKGIANLVASRYLNFQKAQTNAWQFIDDSSGVAALAAEQLSDMFIGQDKYKNWQDFIKADEYKTQIRKLEDSFEKFYKSLDANNLLETFDSMMSNAEDYTVEDFNNIFGEVDSYEEISNIIISHYTERVAFISDLFTNRLKQILNKENITDNDVKDNELLKKVKDIADAKENVSDGERNFLSQSLDVYNELIKRGSVDRADAFSLYSSALFDEIQNLPSDIQKQLLATILENGILTKEGIEKTLDSIKDDSQITRTGVDEALKSIEEVILSNIPLAIQTATSDLLNDWEDSEKELTKALSGGLTVKEADSLISKAKALGIQLDFATDFYENGDKLILTSEAWQKYWEALNFSTDASVESWTSDIEKAEAILNKRKDYTGRNRNPLTSEELDWIDQISPDFSKNADYFEVNGALSEKGWNALEEAVQDDKEGLERFIEYRQKEADLLKKQEDWNKGIYSDLALNLSELESIASDTKLGREGIDADKRLVQEKLNSAYSSLINDVISKGVENINLADYEGLADESVYGKINLTGGLTEVVKRYAKLAGKITTDEVNDLIIQAMEKEAEQTTGAAADAIKDVTFTGRESFASLDTIGKLANAFDVSIENLVGEYNAALDAYQVDMSAISADKLEKIANYSNIVADSVANFLSSVVSAIGNGIQGKLDNAGRDNLISNLKQYNIELSDLDFTKTAEGLKLSEQAAIRLYQQISAIDALQGQIVFDELRKSLETRGSAFENISTTTAEVVRLQKELAEAQSKGAPSTWSDSEKAKIEKLEKELQLAQEIQRAQSQDPSQYDFMNRDLPDYLKGPQNYWNSVGEAYKVMNESAKSGYMEIDDFYNIINEMSNLAALSGKEIEFMGVTIDQSGEGAAKLIDKGLYALSNIDGEGVKIDLSALSKGLETSAKDMGTGFDKAIQEMARSQIKMLDGMIRLLETVVAMEELGDIDLSGNNNGILELGELFEVSYEEDGQAFLKASEVAQKTAGHILKLAEDNDELNQDLDSVEFNNKTLRTILQDLQNGVIMSQEDAELYTSALNSLYQMVQSGEYDLDNLMTSVQEIAGKSGFVGEIKIDDAKIAIGYGVALEADNNGEYHIGTQTTTDPDKALNLAVLEGLGADLTNATFSGKGKDIEVTAPLTLGKQTVEVSSKEGEVTYKDDNGEYASLRELLDKNWARLSAEERETYENSEAKFIETEYSAEVLAQVNVGDAQITNEEDFKNRTQEKVKNLADSLVSGEQDAIKTAAEAIGITVTTDIDGNISAETMQQLADIAGIDSKIVALSVTTSVEGPIGEAGVNSLLGEEELPEKPITLNATLNDETGLLSGEDNEEPIPIEKEVLVTPTNIKLLSEGIEPKLEGELEPARVEQILVEILTAAFNAEETDFGDRIITLPDGETEVKVVDLIDAILAQVALKTSGDYDYSQEITLPGDAQLTLAEAFALLASLVLNWQEDPHIDSSAILPEGELIDLGTREGKVTVSNVKVTYNSPELSEDILDRKLYAPEDGDWTQVQVSIAGAKTSVEEYVSAMQAAIENGNVLSALDLSNLMVLKEGNLIDQDTFDSVIDSLTALIEDSNALSTEAGNAIIEGLTTGTEESGPVGESIQTLTDLVETKLREGLGWHSPSALAQEAGQSIVEGLAIGMEDPSIAISAAEALAQAIVDAIQTYFNTNPITYSLLGNTTQPTGTNDTSGTNSGSAQTGGAIDTSFLTTAIAETQNMMSIVGETFSKSAGEINNVAKSVESIKTDKVDAIQKAQNLIKHDKVDAIQTAQSNISNSKVLELQTAANSINPVPAQSARDAINGIKSTIEVGVNLTVNATGGTVTGVTGGTSLGTNKTNVKLTKQRGPAKAKGTKTLMGELGPELVVSNGHYFVVGANGPEMVDLDEDAIVFNHLQTADLLKKGKISTTGTPITNERKAISFATGNVGPAQASASSALAALKQIRQMWQSMLDASLKDLGGMASPSGGGGGGGGDTQKELEGIVAEIEEWYNWLKKIDDIQKQINIKQKEYNNLQKDRIANGKTIYTNLMDRVNLSRQEMEYHKGLVEAQQARYDEELAKMRSNDVFNALYQVDSNGIFQRAGDNAFANFVRAHGNASLADQLGTGSITITTEKAQTESEKNEGKEIEYESATITLPANGMEMLRDLVEQNANGETKYSANQQYEILKQLGFSDWLKYDTNGKALFEDANNPTQEEIQNAVSVFIERWDATPDYFDGLRDSIQEHKEATLDLESEIYDIEQIIIDNQIDLENKVLKAIEDMRQAEIDALQDERDAYQDAVDAMVKGLNNALNKERQMYQNQQNQDELERLQRQLALAQRTGASGATIRNLQNQVQSKQQEIYFEERQQEIDAIQEAANQQIERLDRQIELMTETLAYQQENGLLWEEVYKVLQGSPFEIADFIEQNTKEYKEKSITELEGIQEQDLQSAQLYKSAVEDGFTASTAETIGNATSNKEEITNKIEETRSDVVSATNAGAAKREEEKKAAAASSGGSSGGGSSGGGTAETPTEAGQTLLEKVEEAVIDKLDTAAGKLKASKMTQTKSTYTAQQVVNKDTTSKKAVQTLIDDDKAAGYNKSSSVTQALSNLSKNLAAVVKNTGTTAKATGAKGANAITKPSGATVKTLKFATGGLNTTPGFAWLDGTTAHPEYVLSADQTAFLRDELLNSRDSFHNIIGELQAVTQQIVSPSTFNTNNVSNDGVTIENINVTMQNNIANDYDVNRANDKFFDAMVKTARKAGYRNVSRR